MSTVAYTLNMKKIFISLLTLLLFFVVSCNYKREIKPEEISQINGELYYFPDSVNKEGVRKIFSISDKNTLEKIIYNINDAYEFERGKRILNPQGILELYLCDGNAKQLFCFRIYIESNDGTILINESCNKFHIEFGCYNNDDLGYVLKDYLKNQHQINL